MILMIKAKFQRLLRVQLLYDANHNLRVPHHGLRHPKMCEDRYRSQLVRKHHSFTAYTVLSGIWYNVKCYSQRSLRCLQGVFCACVKIDDDHKRRLRRFPIDFIASRYAKNSYIDSADAWSSSDAPSANSYLKNKIVYLIYKKHRYPTRLNSILYSSGISLQQVSTN